MHDSSEVRKRIRLSQKNDIHEFIRLAYGCDFDVGVGYDKVFVDAKSLIGVLGLDFRRELVVSLDGMSEKMEKFLEKHQSVDRELLRV